MANKYLDSNGVLYFWQKIRNTFVSNITYDSSTRKLTKVKKTGTNGAEESTDLVTLSKVATSNSYADLDNKPTIPAAVQPTTTTPKMDGTAAVGSETKYAKGDHVHPSDTSKVDKVEGKGLSTNDYTTTEKDKLSGIAAGAEVNQNAFSNVKVGSTTVAADSKTDTLELVAGSNVTLTPDATNDKVTIAAKDTTYNDATTSTHGLMSTADKTKLDSISGSTLDIVAGSNVTVTPNTTNGTLTIAAENTTYSVGTAAQLTAGTDIVSRVWEAKIIADYVKGQIQTAITGSAAFQGTAPTSFAPTNYKKGYYWVVGTAGTYVGETCEPGDMIFAVADYESSYKAADFNVVQTNLDITAITNAEIDTIVAA